jgi:hypothetical protein
MPIDFPSSPTTGQVYTYEGKSWVYNGTGWDSPRALSEIGAVQTFANAAARTAAIPTPTEGIVSYLNDVDRLDIHNGTTHMPAVSVGAYTSYTPTITGITLGNGSTTAAFTRIGKTTFGHITFILGSTSAITGVPVFTLPTTRKSTSFFNVNVALNDFGTGALPALARTDGNTMRIFALTVASAPGPVNILAISATVPFTWTTGDFIQISFNYEEE